MEYIKEQNTIPSDFSDCVCIYINSWLSFWGSSKVFYFLFFKLPAATQEAKALSLSPKVGGGTCFLIPPGLFEYWPSMMMMTFDVNTNTPSRCGIEIRFFLSLPRCGYLLAHVCFCCWNFKPAPPRRFEANPI